MKNLNKCNNKSNQHKRNKVAFPVSTLPRRSLKSSKDKRRAKHCLIMAIMIVFLDFLTYQFTFSVYFQSFSVCVPTLKHIFNTTILLSLVLFVTLLVSSQAHRNCSSSVHPCSRNKSRICQNIRTIEVCIGPKDGHSQKCCCGKTKGLFNFLCKFCIYTGINSFIYFTTGFENEETRCQKHQNLPKMP